MRYRELGRTGFKVSEIGVGGEWLDRLDLAQTCQILDYCFDKGINILDCYMSNPSTRSNIGSAIHDHRNEWLIEGHFGSIWENGQYKRSRDMNKVRSAFEDLLRRMKTDYIDIGMIHYVDEISDLNGVFQGEFMEYVQECKQKGLIRAVGMSSHNPEVAIKAVETGLLDVLLFSVNPAYDILPPVEDVMQLFEDAVFQDETLAGIAPERAALYQLCQRREVGVTVMKGFAGGRLFNEQTSPFGVALTPVQCIHYALTRPAVSSVMVGFGDIKHVDDAVAYEISSSDERDYASVLAQAPRHSYYGQCTYCGHCAPCAAGIDIAMVNKLLDLAVMQEKMPETVREHYLALEHRADECLQCGACLSRCPFGVKIIHNMQRAKQIFTFA
ncbi:MAG: aldo/keto reductase [bacterium]|nr:aldo/keto reductase [bacterium]